MLSEVDARVIVTMASGATNPASLRQNAILIRTYGQDAIDAILLARKDYKKWLLATQQNWQHKVSRRAQKNAHHDSWAIRENYMRNGNGYQEFYSTGHSLIRNAIAQGAKTNIYASEHRYFADKK